MGTFLNQNSLLLVAILIELLAAWYFLRDGLTAVNFLRLLVVTLIIAGSFFGLRPSRTSGDETAEILGQVGQGVPVLIEFKSPN